MNERIRKTSEPFTTRQYLTGTIVFGALSFIPVLGWFSALALIFSLCAWILLDFRGFLSVVWRTLMGAVLLCSVLIFCDALLWNPHSYSGEVNTSAPYFLTAAVLSFALSVAGIVRSFLTAH
jgi:hypothetical protein